mmetsp:Transcript_16201/g.17459  ORF Transcript_16201/g.17459 Transcript_16201/m.17459 type:complete len:435 (-) Transcript_16201:419-1723(-)
MTTAATMDTEQPQQESATTTTAVDTTFTTTADTQQPPPPPPTPPPPLKSDYELFSKAIARVLPPDRKFASLTQLHQFMKLFMSFWDVPRLVHGSGALSCHYRKRTLKRQITPEAVERRGHKLAAASGGTGQGQSSSRLDDYNCPFKLTYSKLRFAKNSARRTWKPRIFHIAKISSFNTCHSCQHLHDDKQNNYQNYDKSDVSAFAKSVRSFQRTPSTIDDIYCGGATTTTSTTDTAFAFDVDGGGAASASKSESHRDSVGGGTIATGMYNKDAWTNMTNHFFDNCCTIDEYEEHENGNNIDVTVVTRRTITIHQSRSSQERKKPRTGMYSLSARAFKNQPENNNNKKTAMDVDASVTNFDNLAVLVQFWSEFIKRNPNEAYKTNAWGGVFDILRTICEDPLIGKPNMREMKGLLTALGTAADPVAGATLETRVN